MIYHPDRNPAGAQKFAEISMVYDILSNETLRQIYDLTGEKGISQFTNAQSCCGGCSGELGCGGGDYEDSDEEDYDSEEDEADRDEEREGLEHGEVRPEQAEVKKTPDGPQIANEHNSMRNAIRGDEYMKRQMSLRQMQDQGMTNQAGMMGVMGFSGMSNMAMAGVMHQMGHGGPGHTHPHGSGVTTGHFHGEGDAGHSHSHGIGTMAPSTSFGLRKAATYPLSKETSSAQGTSETFSHSRRARKRTRWDNQSQNNDADTIDNLKKAKLLTDTQEAFQDVKGGKE